jgi:AcrR family transcriptional regulator
MNMMETSSPGRRTYRQKARARAAAATADRILDAAFQRFSQSLFDEVTLAAIATEAGVSEQTVIRRFGSKEQLFAAVGERERARIEAQREPDASEPASMAAAVRTLVGHYERDGRTMLNFLAQESRSPLIADVLADGRAVHAAWVERHCATSLGPTDGAARSERLAAAIVATDLYAWKLMRLDRGLSPREVEGVMVTLLEGLARTAGEV